MLGLARRAGRLSMGHDMALKAVMSRKAEMLLFCADVSPRLVKEFKKTLALKKINIPVFETALTMDEIHFYVGYRAGVLTIDDVNFSDKIIKLLIQEEIANDN